MGRLLRVLIVEDSELDVELLLHTLQCGDYQVAYEVVDTPQSMREMLTDRQWDLITSDHSMPQFNAPKALAIAKEICPDVPFLIVSGEIDLNLAVSLMRDGANDYIQKRELPRLLPAVERVLKEAAFTRERLQVDQALKESYHRFQEVLENSLDASYKRLIESNVYDYLSPVFTQITGYPLDEMISLPFESYLELIHPDDLPQMKRVVNEALSDPARRAFQVEYRIRHKMGHYLWLLDKFSVVRDPNGQPEAFIGSVSDITERKKVDEELLASYAQLNGILDNLQDAYIRADKNGLIVRANHAAARMYGYVSNQEMVGQPVVKCYADPADRERAFQELRKTGRIRDWIYQCVRTDGTLFWVSLNGQLILDQHQQLIGSEGVVRDITERRQAEEALLLSIERERLRASQLDAVLKALPVGVAITDELGGEIMQNEAFFQVWGGQPPETYTVQDYRGYSAWWVESGEPVKPEEWASAQAVQHGITVLNQFIKIKRFDGKYAYVLNSASPVRNAQGKIIGSAVAIQDITALREAQQALEEMNEALEAKVHLRTQDLKQAEANLRLRNQELEAILEKEKALRNQLIQVEKYAALARLIASVAHEIQNPLQTVRNSFYLLGQENISPEVREVLEMAQEESQRMSELVEQLRETYRPMEFHEVEFDVGDILEKVRRLLDPQFRQNKVKWSLEIQPARVVLRGVPDRIQQVFMNICLNATDAMGTGGDLKVTVSQTRENVCVSIQDSGPGIAPEHLEKIFEPFFTTKPKGTGLGLAICYEIVKDHGGEIVVESRLGKGSTFRVYLPFKKDGDHEDSPK